MKAVSQRRKDEDRQLIETQGAIISEKWYIGGTSKLWLKTRRHSDKGFSRSTNWPAFAFREGKPLPRIGKGENP